MAVAAKGSKKSSAGKKSEDRRTLVKATKSQLTASFAPKNVAIMYRPDTKEAIRQANELAVWLNEQGFAVYSALNQELKKPAHKLTPAKIAELDWVIVLGGDGTYLGAVRMLEGRQIPILGVNMGSLGFLTEIRIEDLYKAIIGTLQHKMEFKVRSMLSVQVKRKGRLTAEYVALNDAVIERGSNTHLINIEVFNESQLVAAVKADALVVATPTGSTAYNLAAGGPILHPDVCAIVMTPVCPHALTSRPLIFPDDQKLSFKLVTQDKRVVLTVDGVNRGEITHDDEIVITRSKIDHFVIRKPSSNYFTLLREKLAFGQRA